MGFFNKFLATEAEAEAAEKESPSVDRKTVEEAKEDPDIIYREGIRIEDGYGTCLWRNSYFGHSMLCLCIPVSLGPIVGLDADCSPEILDKATEQFSAFYTVRTNKGFHIVGIPKSPSRSFAFVDPAHVEISLIRGHWVLRVSRKEDQRSIGLPSNIVVQSSCLSTVDPQQLQLLEEIKRLHQAALMNFRDVVFHAA